MNFVSAQGIGKLFPDVFSPDPVLCALYPRELSVCPFFHILKSYILFTSFVTPAHTIASIITWVHKQLQGKQNREI